MAKRGRKRKYTKRVKNDASITAEMIIKEVHELKKVYTDNLLRIREELIKSRQGVRNLSNSMKYRVEPAE